MFRKWTRGQEHSYRNLVMPDYVCMTVMFAIILFGGKNIRHISGDKNKPHMTGWLLNCSSICQGRKPDCFSGVWKDGERKELGDAECWAYVPDLPMGRAGKRLYQKYLGRNVC